MRFFASLKMTVGWKMQKFIPIFYILVYILTFALIFYIMVLSLKERLSNHGAIKM